MTARKIRTLTKCMECEKEITSGKVSRKYCDSRCGVKWRTKNIYKYKYAHVHNSRNPFNFMRRLLVKRGKEDRGQLTIEHLMGLWASQNGLCAISGVPLTHICGEGRVGTNVSLDRIVAGGPYNEGNVQLVTCYANGIKGTMSMEDLYKYCKAILANRKMQPKRGKKGRKK